MNLRIVRTVKFLPKHPDFSSLDFGWMNAVVLNNTKSDLYTSTGDLYRFCLLRLQILRWAHGCAPLRQPIRLSKNWYYECQNNYGDTFYRSGCGNSVMDDWDEKVAEI
jgi:hypothetical protein